MCGKCDARVRPTLRHLALVTFRTYYIFKKKLERSSRIHLVWHKLESTSSNILYRYTVPSELQFRVAQNLKKTGISASCHRLHGLITHQTEIKWSWDVFTSHNRGPKLAGDKYWSAGIILFRSWFLGTGLAN